MGLPTEILAPIAIATSIIGSGVSAIGALQGSRAQAAQGAYQAQVSANNAKIAQQNAALAIQTGEAKGEATSLKNRETMGTIRANQAASGVDVDTGSPVDVRTTQRELGNLATQTDIYNSQLQAYGYRSQQTNFQAQSQLYAYEAPQALTGAEIGAAGTALGSASKWFGPSTFSANSFFGGGSPSGYGA